MGSFLENSETMGLGVFFFLLLAIAVATVCLLVALARPLVRRVEDTNRALVARFKMFGFIDRLLSRRVFMVGRYEGVHMVAHWFMKQEGVRTVPTLVVHAKVPHTSHIKMHAATKLHGAFAGVESFVKLVGWREVGPFMVAQGHEASIDAERAVVEQLSSKTVAHLVDAGAFPHGLALRTGYFPVLYGGAVALALAGGDEELAMSMDVEVTVPFSMSDGECERLLRNIAHAARMIEEDLDV